MVLAPSPLAPGRKLVLRALGLSFTQRDNFFWAPAGDSGSFSTVLFRRLVTVGTTNLPVLSMRGGAIVADEIEDVVPVLL
jgi:hypothetical protein